MDLKILGHESFRGSRTGMLHATEAGRGSSVPDCPASVVLNSYVTSEPLHAGE